MQNDNAKLDNELAVLAAFAVAYMVQNAQSNESFSEARDLVQKYGLVEAMGSTPPKSDIEALQYLDKAIANIQDKIEEYNALER